MTREEILAFFERRQEMWRRRDAAALAADHAEDSLVQSPTQALQRGREAIESVYRLWFTAFPDYQFLQEEVLIDGHRAVVIARTSARTKGSSSACRRPGAGSSAASSSSTRSRTARSSTSDGYWTSPAFCCRSAC